MTGCASVSYFCTNFMFCTTSVLFCICAINFLAFVRSTSWIWNIGVGSNFFRAQNFSNFNWNFGTFAQLLQVALTIWNLLWFSQTFSEVEVQCWSTTAMYHLENSPIAASPFHWVSAERRIVLHQNTLHTEFKIVDFCSFLWLSLNQLSEFWFGHQRCSSWDDAMLITY